MTIQWESSGISAMPTAGVQKKLRIWLKKSGVATCSIADNVSPQPKSHSWRVGDCSAGTAGPGSGYQLVVELKGTQIKGESTQPFQIVESSSTISIVPGEGVSVRLVQKKLPMERTKSISTNNGSAGVSVKPNIRTISPSRVLPGTKISVNGAWFTTFAGSKQLKMVDQAGSAFLLNVLRWTDTLLYAEVPPGLSLNYPVVIYDVGIWDASGKISNTVPITVQGPCTISEVTPSSGVGGMAIALLGSNFGENRSKELRFERGLNRFPVKVMTWADTLIIADLPEGITSGDYHFSVAMNTGQIICGGAGFKVSAPVISNIGPERGQFLATQSFSITGKGFGDAGGKEVRISDNGVFPHRYWSDDGILVQLDRALSRGTHRVSLYYGGRRISNEMNITAIGPAPGTQQ